jgi:aspartate aminotransferase
LGEPVLSKRVKKVKPSATLEITAKAKALRDEGKDIIAFGAGEPDFDTPQHIKDALVDALEGGFIYYTPAAGIPELREAVSKKLKRDNGLDYGADETIVTPGAKQAIYEAVQAVVNPEDEVLIPDPWWVSYVPMVQLAEGRPVFVETYVDDGFRLKVEEIEKKVTDRTRAIIINSPNNPTGSVLTKDDLKGIADVCVDNDVIVIADEVYEPMTYGCEHTSIASFDGMKERTITVNGFSKAYSMTGWRLGYAAGPQDIIKAMTRIQAHSVSNTTSFVQKAGVAALDGPQECVKEMVGEFKKRRDVIVKILNEIDGVKCNEPQGAFYAFANFGSYEPDSFKLANYLLENGVAVIPGGAFGKQGEGFLRLSYATSMENIKEGVKRIEKALENLK